MFGLRLASLAFAVVAGAVACNDAVETPVGTDRGAGGGFDAAAGTDIGTGEPADVATGADAADGAGSEDAETVDAVGGDEEFDSGIPDTGGAFDAGLPDDVEVPDGGSPDGGADDQGNVGPDVGIDAGADAGDDAGTADASQPVEYPPDKWGKFQAGVYNNNMIYDADRKRSVPMYFWYPASGQSAKQATYMGVMKGQAWEDAPAAKSEGPFPLILFSHGFKGIAFQSFSLTEYLASHGFVVAAPNHQGNTLFDFTSTDEDVAKVTLERPKDVYFAYQKAVEFGKTSGNVLEGIVREDLTAVTGHSFGAFTAIIVAGSEADMDRAKAACAQGVEADIFCDYVPYYAPGTMLRMDPRIPGLKALVALAPGGYNAMFDDNLAKVYVPGLTMGGTEDTTCPLDIETRPIYNGMPKPKSKAELTGATHMSFTNVCSIPLAQQIFGDMCKATMTEERAFEIINTLTTAYLRLHVNGETGMRAWLTDSYISQSLSEIDWLDEP
jgi:predicted dienelactone hydrolase